MKDFDPYKINRRLELAVKRVKNSDVDQENKDVILEFRDYAFAEGLSKQRVLKYLNILLKLSRLLEIPFSKASKKNIIELVRYIEEKEYSPWTKHDYKVILKKFFKWLRGGEEYPEEVKWIKSTIKKSNNTLPEELLTAKDVEKLIKEADHPRDKSLISLLYESGCRVGEALAMRIKHVSFDDYGAKIIMNGKTGTRRIRIISSVQYLATWLENHSLKENPDAPLWVGIGTRNKNKAIKYQNVRSLLIKLAKRADINKKVNPHIFRHSRATHLANHLTEAQMNQYFGWVQGSDMPSTYVHLSGRDVDNAILKLHGLAQDKEKGGEKFSPIDCPRCDLANSPGVNFCMRCGAPLNLKTAIKASEEREKMDNLMSKLIKDSDVQRFLAGKIEEMGLNV